MHFLFIHFEKHLQVRHAGGFVGDQPPHPGSSLLDVAVRELKSSWVPLAAAASTFQHGGILLVLCVGLWVVGDCGLRVCLICNSGQSLETAV